VWRFYCKSSLPLFDFFAYISFYQRDAHALVVWSFDLDHIIPLCDEFERKIIKHVWRTRGPPRETIINTHVTPEETTGSQSNLTEKAEDATARETKPSRRRWWNWSWSPSWSWKLQPPAPADPEKGPGLRKERKLVLLGPFYAGCGAALATCACLSHSYFFHII
jgi:hypothetical protein